MEYGADQAPMNSDFKNLANLMRVDITRVMQHRLEPEIQKQKSPDPTPGIVGVTEKVMMIPFFYTQISYCNQVIQQCSVHTV